MIDVPRLKKVEKHSSSRKWRTKSKKIVKISIAYLIVVEREVYRDVPLEGDGHRHEDGARDRRLVQRVQEVGEQQDVNVRLKLGTKKN
jgi:hypothetical protein